MIIHKHDDWLRLLFAVKGTALRQIWPRMAVTVLIAVAVTVLHQVRPFREFSLTTVPFTLVGFALAVFLGFRNNTSYARYWEGNALMSRVINASRSLSRPRTRGMRTRRRRCTIGPAMIGWSATWVTALLAGPLRASPWTTSHS